MPVSAVSRVQAELPAADAQPEEQLDLVGRLRSFTFSDVLQLLALSGQTGTLTLAQGWNSRTLTFEHGRIVYIAAATRLAGAGQLLLAAGRLTPEQLDAALALARADEIRLEDALL